MKMPKSLSIAVLMSLGLRVATAYGGGISDLIPTPQECKAAAGQLKIAGKGISGAEICISDKATFKERLAAERIAERILKLSGARIEPSVYRKKRGNGPGVLLSVYKRNTFIDKHAAKLLDAADIKVLSDPGKTGQAYVLITDNQTIAIVGTTEQGTFWGAMTLLQLMQKVDGDLVVQNVRIRDWPAFKNRGAAHWTYGDSSAGEGCGWGFDWGDGVDEYVKRVKGQLDWYLQYKINFVAFNGWQWKWKKLVPYVTEINQYARARGMKLMFGGHGNGYYGGFNGLLNRKSYPDGEVYHCVGYHYQKSGASRTWGNCRSNEAQNKIKQKAMIEFVKNIEPGALYIHFEDVGHFEQLQKTWQLRCDDCRKKWPNDDAAAVDGAAGCVSYGNNKLLDAIFSVKNEKTGYNASRDCLVLFVSPGYSFASARDEPWDKLQKYWANVSKLLGHKDSKRNINICIREQLLRYGNNKRRVAGFAETLKEQGGGHGVVLFSFSGSCIYWRDSLFAATPVMAKVNEGADTLFYSCGRIFQEPQILLNAEYMWNTESTGFYDVPKTAGKCMDRFNEYVKGQIRPREIYGAGGFLEKACTEVYGTQAGAYMKKVYELKVTPICYIFSLMRRDQVRKDYDWTPSLKATQEAISYLESALSCKDFKAEHREVMERFLMTLRSGEKFANLRVDYSKIAELTGSEEDFAQKVKALADGVESKMVLMEEYLEKTFTSDWATPVGGDVKHWEKILAGMRKQMNILTSNSSVKDTIRQMIPEGSLSVVINGNMEGEDGWQYKTSPGSHYEDGGYVAEKAMEGKRSYKLIHGSIGRGDRWPKDKKTEWAQISQEITLEPGLKYIVAFGVYNNYGGAKKFLEHQIFFDDKKMWYLDASAPKGWKVDFFSFIPTTEKIVLKLRTTDLRWTHSWGNGGCSWWDSMGVYKIDHDGQE